MTTPREWVDGARPRTLWTSVAPVAVGSAAASQLGSFRPALAALALVVALALQVASNYANDYADGVRGTDIDRIGPTRLVASGKARPSVVKRAAFIATAVGAAAGLALVAWSGAWWLLAVGAVAVGAAWAYTATSRPYGYRGWGEVSVWVFFGPVATLGTLYAQAGRLTWWAGVAGASVGLYAVALLMVNNLRDRAGDEIAGKRTLAVKLGDAATRLVFAVVVMVPTVGALAIGPNLPWAMAASLVALPSLASAIAVLLGARGPALRPVFLGLGWVGMTYAALLAAGIAIS